MRSSSTVQSGSMPSSLYRAMKSVGSDTAVFGARMVPDSVRETVRRPASRARARPWHHTGRAPVLRGGHVPPAGRPCGFPHRRPFPHSPLGGGTCAMPWAASALPAPRPATCNAMSDDHAKSGQGPRPARRQRLANGTHRLGLLPLLQGARRLLRRDLRVLAYHRVRELGDGFAFDPDLVSATPEDFRAQMRHVAQRFHPVSCREVVAALDGGPALPRDPVLVTFDDGYDDNHAIAFPILREFGVPATFFVATGHIDNGLPYGYDWLAHLVVTARTGRLQLPTLDID